MQEDVERSLSRLRELRAPQRLADRVLESVGLGHWYSTFDTSIGPVFVAFGPSGLAAIDRATSSEEFEAWFQKRFRVRLRRTAQLPAELRREVAEALIKPSRRLALDLAHMSDFERSVLLKTLEIPRGEVRTYAWVAKEIGHPRAVRAVGGALADNPIPLVIPCHRVIRSDGRIGQYGCGGPVAKRTLLAEEGADPDRLEELARRGVRFLGSDTTRIFCLPSCRAAKRISDRHRIPFSSDAEALAAGFRACRICRPVGAAAAA